jgi:tyrosine-protein kinase Etk/Wzc
MNAPHSMQQLSIPQPAPYAVEDESEVSLLEYWDIIVDNRWLIAAVTAGALLFGGAYAFLSKPVYEANLLIQVEDSSTSAQGLLGEAASLFDVKTAASAEIEILRSRMVIGSAVDTTRHYITARPRYLPIVGNWLASRAASLSDPGFFGFGGWVTGSEKIEVAAFDVPAPLQGTPFTLTAAGAGRFVLTHEDMQQQITGQVGSPLTASTPMGSLTLTVTRLEGKQGAEFEVVRFSRLQTITAVQEALQITERGRQSGVIDATLQDSDRTRLTAILNEIGTQYVRQNVERKAAEAQKTLNFLDVQLPQFKKQLDASEDAYNRYRNQKGTVALDEEAKLILGRSVDLQGKLMEAQQKRLELVARFTNEHPAVRTLDGQIAAWNAEIASLNARVKTMPTVQQDAIRLEREVKVNNDLYQQLRNSAIQMQLVREGKIGNVRLIDPSARPEEPVKPKRALALALALMLGLVLGTIAAFVRNSFFRGIRNAQEIEASTGLNVYSTIPLSKSQQAMAHLAATRQAGIHVLVQTAPQDPAVESLRSLRTALQFAMLDSPNNRLLITGPTPGVGKSFVSTNFAAVLASAGKRVLLVDADLRKGHINQYLGVGRERGLSELVAGSLKKHDVIRRGILPNLDLITTGVLPPNPAELLASPALIAVLESLSAEYDLVVIDTAPVLVAADTQSLAPHAGTLLLVARADQTQLGELHESSRRLAHAGSRVTGVLVNAVDLTRRHYGSYGYKYGGYRYRQYAYEAPGAAN